MRRPPPPGLVVRRPVVASRRSPTMAPEPRGSVRAPPPPGKSFIAELACMLTSAAPSPYQPATSSIGTYLGELAGMFGVDLAPSAPASVDTCLASLAFLFQTPDECYDPRDPGGMRCEPCAKEYDPESPPWFSWRSYVPEEPRSVWIDMCNEPYCPLSPAYEATDFRHLL